MNIGYGSSERILAMSAEEEDVPEELEEQCTKCHVSLAGIEQLLQSVMSVSRTQMEDKLESLDAASEILLLTYTMNSLFWVYLATHGVDPKSHPIKRELDRVQKAMQRARAISNKTKQAGVRINTDAAKRFVRNALWEAEQEAGDQQQQQQQQKKKKEKEGLGESSGGSERKETNPNSSSGDGGALDEADSSYSGGKKRKLDAEDTPTKRTRLE